MSRSNLPSRFAVLPGPPTAKRPPSGGMALPPPPGRFTSTPFISQSYPCIMHYMTYALGWFAATPFITVISVYNILHELYALG